MPLPFSLLNAFGFVVRTRRERKGMSQEALAEMARLHRTYVGSIERGERNVSLKNIQSLAIALGTQSSELLADAEALLTKEGRRN